MKNHPSLDGAKVRDIHFSAYRLDLVQYFADGGKFEDLENPILIRKRKPESRSLGSGMPLIPEEDIPQFELKGKADLPEPGAYLIHSVASSLDRQQGVCEQPPS